MISRIGITKVNSINDWPRCLPALTRLPPDRILAHPSEIATKIVPTYRTILPTTGRHAVSIRRSRNSIIKSNPTKKESGLSPIYRIFSSVIPNTSPTATVIHGSRTGLLACRRRFELS